MLHLQSRFDLSNVAWFIFNVLRTSQGWPDSSGGNIDSLDRQAPTNIIFVSGVWPPFPTFFFLSINCPHSCHLPIGPAVLHLWLPKKYMERLERVPYWNAAMFVFTADTNPTMNTIHVVYGQAPQDVHLYWGLCAIFLLQADIRRPHSPINSLFPKPYIRNKISRRTSINHNNMQAKIPTKKDTIKSLI